MLEPIIISLGSNIGNRIGFIYKALALIEEHPVTIRELSNVYETPLGDSIAHLFIMHVLF